MRDFYSNIRVSTGLKSMNVGASTNPVGAVLSLRPFRRVCYVVSVGAMNGGPNFVKLQHSADGVTWVDVPAAQVQSDIPVSGIVDGASYRLGYLGAMPFLRPTLFGPATGVQISVVAVVDPLSKPVA